MTFRLFLTLGFLLWSFSQSCFAEPAFLVLTDSKNPAIQTKAGEAKSWLGKLRKANQLEDFQLPVSALDIANPAIATEWKQRFGVTKADLPAVAYVERQGNKISDLGLLIKSYPDSVKAAQSVFKYAQTRDASIEVTEVPTLLSVTSSPEGATVLIGGQEVGVTPLAEAPVSPGQATLEVRHPDCQVWTQPLAMKLGDAQSVTAELTVLPGALRVESETPVQISVGGEAPQPSPLRLEHLSPGPLLLKVTAPAEQSFTVPVRISGGKRTVVVIPEIKPPTLRVASVVGSARGTRQQGQNITGAQYDVSVNIEASEINGSAMAALQDAGMDAVRGDQPWDFALEWTFIAGGQLGSVRGSVNIIDSGGRTLGFLEGKRGMPLMSFNFSGAAQSKCAEIVRELMPAIVAKLREAPAPAAPAVTPEVRTEPLGSS